MTKCTKSSICEEKNTDIASQSCSKKPNLLEHKSKAGDSRSKPQQPKPYVLPISSLPAKRIKICTGAELKKMCAPPPCPSLPKKPRTTLIMRLARALGFGAKSMLALGAVYVTYEMGIWGDSETTGDLYKSVCQLILPRIGQPVKEKPMLPSCQEQIELFNIVEKDPHCCDKFPIDHQQQVYEYQQKWNKVVTTIFSNVAQISQSIGKWSQQMYCSVVDSKNCEHSAPPKDDECDSCN